MATAGAINTQAARRFCAASSMTAFSLVNFGKKSARASEMAMPDSDGS
jgi:hypothetical protein